MFGCGAPLQNSAGMDGITTVELRTIEEAPHGGRLRRQADRPDADDRHPRADQLAPGAKTLLEKGGFKVDMQSMDWQTQVSRRAKKDPVDKGGWNISMTAASVALLSDPIINHYTEASGDRAQFGWPLDEEIEKLRMEFVREGDAKKQFEIAEKVQKRVLDLGVTVPLGSSCSRWHGGAASRAISSLPSRCSGTSRRNRNARSKRLSRTPRNANLAAITTASVGETTWSKRIYMASRPRWP